MFASNRNQKSSKNCRELEIWWVGKGGEVRSGKAGNGGEGPDLVGET